MTCKFVGVMFAIFGVFHQINAGCLPVPPPCAFPGLLPGLASPDLSLAGLALPSLGLPSLGLPSLALPASLPCPPVPNIIQQSNIKIPLPLPAEIPLGNFCSCKKYEIAPTLLPCAPAPPAAALPAPLPPPPPPSAPGLALSPALLKALLGSLPSPCAAPPPPPALCPCA